MRLLITYIILMSLLVSACGWQLRGMQTDKNPLPSINVVSKDNYSAIARSVRNLLQRQDNSIDEDAGYQLQILQEEVEKRPVTYHANGTPAQYEMTLTVSYVVQPDDALEPALPRETETHRIFDFDPRNVVAKSEEERALLEQMRQEIAQRLISEIGREHNSIRNFSADDNTL